MSKALKDLKKRHAELIQQIQDESKDYFKDASKAIFEKYPNLEKFSWTQYTPYFNDGDECTFSVNNYPKLNDMEEYDNREAKALPEAAFNAVENLIGEIDDDTMKAMFGDHVEITVTREGVTIDEYSHD